MDLGLESDLDFDFVSGDSRHRDHPDQPLG
jgi:hypothetical protein